MVCIECSVWHGQRHSAARVFRQGGHGRRSTAAHATPAFKTSRRMSKPSQPATATRTARGARKATPTLTRSLFLPIRIASEGLIVGDVSRRRER